MAHLTSAPALRTAREIIRAYTMTPLPSESLKTGRLDGLTSSERHVATLIDHSTNVHEVVKLRPEFHHWQRHLCAGVATAPQLAAFMHRISAALAEVPHAATGDVPEVSTFRVHPTAKTRPIRRALSKPSLEVSRVLFYYYRMEPVGRAASDALDRKYVAEIVETCLGLPRIMSVEGAFRRMREDLLAGRVAEVDVVKFMRSAGILFDRLPSYENREEEVMILA